MKSLVIFCSISDTLPLGNVVSSLCQKSLMSKDSTIFKCTPALCVQDDLPLETYNFQEKHTSIDYFHFYTVQENKIQSQTANYLH